MSTPNPKIYLLPNLMTAGNLFCGFAATLQIVQGALLQVSDPDAAAKLFHIAVWFILGACIFDVLDGRLARLGGHDSAFGREFDSLADVISFGLAPALMVYRIVLLAFPRVGWVVAFIYLLCGALRLARFNVAAAEGVPSNNKEFLGFPITAAAGLIASITLFMLWWFGERDHEIGEFKWVLPPLMVFLSIMMFSRLRYPSFKAVTWRTTRSLSRFLVIAVVLLFTVLNYEWMPAVLFLVYLLYGLVRPWVSKAWQREIEEEIGEQPRPRARKNRRKLSVELGENFRIADVGPIAGNFERLNFFARQGEIANGVGQLVFAARRWPELRDVIEDARPKRVDAGVIPRARRLARLRFLPEIGQLELLVYENCAALADIVASLHGQDRLRIA